MLKTVLLNFKQCKNNVLFGSLTAIFIPSLGFHDDIAKYGDMVLAIETAQIKNKCK